MHYRACSGRCWSWSCLFIGVLFSRGAWFWWSRNWCHRSMRSWHWLWSSCRSKLIWILWLSKSFSTSELRHVLMSWPLFGVHESSTFWIPLEVAIDIWSLKLLLVSLVDLLSNVSNFIILFSFSVFIMFTLILFILKRLVSSSSVSALLMPWLSIFYDLKVLIGFESIVHTILLMLLRWDSPGQTRLAILWCLLIWLRMMLALNRLLLRWASRSL